jgi:hypothetical protein
LQTSPEKERPIVLPRPQSRASRLTSNRPAGGRGLAALAACLGALALAGCQRPPPPAATPPADPPSGAIRANEPIPYATLAEHLTFNTKSRVHLTGLTGRLVQVRGPVGKVEPERAGATLHLGAAQGSRVRAHFAEAADLHGVREGQEVDVVGTFAFRGDYVLLEGARLGGDNRPPAVSALDRDAAGRADWDAPAAALSLALDPRRKS